MPLRFDFPPLQDGYAKGTISPSEVVMELFRRIDDAGDDNVWISRVAVDDAVASAHALEALDSQARAAKPLYGFPFAVKDCIDVAGQPTTCACPDFSYVPEKSASAVEKLFNAGAIFIGKTNLDQFATGLVGTRSPYGIPRNPFNTDYIPGGSSSGSAVAVSSGLVSFALGTDTGGSGRVPGSYNNITGLKPTVGRISPHGLVNACRTIDCITVYALTAVDAMTVLDVAEGYDPRTAFSRDVPSKHQRKTAYTAGAPFTFGVPDDQYLEFFGDSDMPGAFEDAIRTMEELGGKAQRFDYSPMLEVNEMMFFGPLLAERYISFGQFLEANPEVGDPVVRGIVDASKAMTAADAFAMLYRIEESKRQLQALWSRMDMMLVPTIGRLWKKADIAADPLGPNFRNGYYTNFVNPLDMAAVATPNGFVRDGMPVGVTLVGEPFTEAFLASLADRFSEKRVATRGA